MLWRLTLAYEGTRFLGFQRQGVGRTVQGELERAIAELTESFAIVRGASRTDSGVHALGQVAAFDTTRELDAVRWPGALNARLDRDVAVLRAEIAPPGFDPQRDAVSKTYRYWIDPSPRPQPIYRRLAMHVPSPLDLAAMRHSGEQLVGELDFQSFCGEVRERTIRRVTALTVAPRDDLIEIRVSASGFLYHMVRNIVGTLVEIGRGRREPDLRATLAGRDRRLAGATAPAHGLTLVEVRFPPRLDRSQEPNG